MSANEGHAVQESMMAFKGKYLGGHPAAPKSGSAKITAGPGGLKVAGSAWKPFSVPWESIKSIKVISESEIKGGPSALSALGAMQGNLLLTTMYANNTKTTKHTFLAIEYQDSTGFESTVLFEMKKAQAAHAQLIADRAKHVSAPTDGSANGAASAAEGGSAATSAQAEPSGSGGVGSILRVLGWLFLPFVMAPIFIAQNRKALFEDRDTGTIVLAGLGTIWALFALVVGVSGQ